MSEEKNTHTITVKVGDKEYKCILREPNFEEYALASASITQSVGKLDMLTAGKVLIQTCWISGDQEIKKNDRILASASIVAASLLDFYDADIKKN